MQRSLWRGRVSLSTLSDHTRTLLHNRLLYSYRRITCDIKSMQSWQSALRLLELHLVPFSLDAARNQPTPAIPADLERRIGAGLVQLRQFKLSRAAWGQMLQAEVPRRVVFACCQVLQHSSPLSTAASAASAARGRTPVFAQVPAVVWRLYCTELPLLLLEGLVKINPPKANQTSPPAQLALLGRQFQQSGFLDLLPQLLRDTADQLQAAAAAEAAAAAAAEAAAAADTGSGAGSSTVRPTQPGTSNPHTAAPLPKPTEQDWVSRPDLLLLQDASQLLQTYSMLALSYPLGKFAFELVPGCAPAVMQLASISFQHISSLLEGNHKDSCIISRMHGLWLPADQAARLALAPDMDPTFTRPCLKSDLDSSGLQQYHSVLFDSPHTGPCIAVMLAYAAYAMLLLQLPSLPDLRASSNGSSSSSSSEDRTKRKLQRCSGANEAWQIACEQHQLLPPSHQALLQQAGCSSKTVLFAAACLTARARSGATSVTVGDMVCLGSNMLLDLIYGHGLYSEHCHSQWQQQQQQQQEGSIAQEQQQQQHVLLCLAPGVMLYWAALHPPEFSPGGSFIVDHALISSRASIDAARQPAAPPTSTYVALCMEPRVSSRSHFPFIPAGISEAMLTDIITLTTRLGAGFYASLGGEGRDSTNSSSSSNSSSRSSRSSAWSSSIAAVTVPNKAKRTLRLVGLLADLAEGTDFSVGGFTADGCLEGQGKLHGPHSASATVWMQHTVAAAKLLEGLVRHSKHGSNHDLLLGLIGDYGPGPIAAGARAAGPGSPEQQQLISLMCSAVKALATPWEQHAMTRVGSCFILANAATGMLLDALWRQVASAAGAAAEPRKAALAAVPWLAIMGRCLLLLAALLHVLCTPSQQDALFLALRAVEGIGLMLQDLLSDDGPASLTAQLTAAGFSSWEAVPEQLQLLEHALTALVVPEGLRTSQDQVSTAAQHMTALGLSLNSLAFPTACNNPRCSNLSGPSELLLVSGRSNMCAGCLVARYCSRDCQRQHWKQHKPVCKALAAAAAKAANADSADSANAAAAAATAAAPAAAAI